MYKKFTADEYRKNLKLPPDYTVHGFIVFGTYNSGPYDQLKEELAKLGVNAIYRNISEHPFLASILEFTVADRKYWLTIAYGGTILSEWTHLACLFGSKANIVIGSCGGLLTEADTPEIVVPTYAYGNESATRMYEPNDTNQHSADGALSQRLIKHLGTKHKVWHGPTMTCQAMLAETWDDIQRWSGEGYFGVEMEASTVFAVSNYFKRSAAAMLVIGDNLIREKTTHDINYEDGAMMRQQVRRDMLQAALREIR